MTHILVVGQNFSELRRKLISEGYKYTTLQDIKKTKLPDKKLKNRVVVDFSNFPGILKAIDKLNATTPITGVISVYENYVLPTAQIAEYLKVPGLPIETARACTDKYLMRQFFAKAPIKISPEFAEVNSWQDVHNFANEHGYPLILKPANLAKSLLVTKSHTQQELLDNYTKMTSSIDKIYEKYAPQRTPKIIIEEFMEGPIHSIDAFVDSNGTPHVLKQIVDYQTGYDIGYDDNFHYSRKIPSKLTSSEVEAIRETATVGCKALGMKNSPAHIEIIRTKQGPMIVEIGARNGGYRERMHSLANGIDILGNALNIVSGKAPEIKAVRNDYCAVLELFPKTAGIFNGIKNEDQLKQLSSLHYYSLKPSIGSFVGKSSDGYKMCAVIILSNSTKEHFLSDLHFVDTSVAVITSPKT